MKLILCDCECCIGCLRYFETKLLKGGDVTMVFFDCRVLEMSLQYCGWTKSKRPYTQPTRMKRRLSHVCTQSLTQSYFYHLDIFSFCFGLFFPKQWAHGILDHECQVDVHY